MNVTVRGKSERSWMMSRRGSNHEEDESAVGAVVVMLSDKTEDQSTAAYRIPTENSSTDDVKLISSSITQKETSFMAVLAPSCDAAMASLQSQPPGTYLLVKEEDTAITVYIKFRRAVRVWILVKSKEVKKNDDAIQMAKVRKSDQDLFMQTPVHYLRLASEVYFLVEHCWKRFLPQVQAIVFELCCETQFDEDIKLEDWTHSMIPPSAYSLSLMPEACGFYILATPRNDADSSTSVIQVCQVEFDFNKFVITIADGTLKPSALLLATSFTAKRTFEPDFTFGAIRDNFLTPDLVILKETSVSSMSSQQSSFQNCLDLSSNDREFSVLSAADAACGSIMPNEPLPESLLAVLHEMHVYFVNTAAGDGTTPSSKPVLYSSQKMKLVGRIIPILLELLIASAAVSETVSPSNQMSVQAIAASENKKKQVLAQFAHSIRFDILFMTARSDESVICRLVHQLCQILGARIRLPAELVNTIRDLVALFPVLLRLFLRNQGTAALWKNIHHNDLDKDADLGSESRRQSNSRSFRSLPTSTTVVNLFQSKGDRRPSMFGLGRKPHTKSRKSLSLGMNLTLTPFLSSKALAFFRLSPFSVQIYLGMHLREGYFMFPDVWKEDPVLAKINLCSCTGQQLSEPISTMAGEFGTKTTTLCARTRLRSSPKLIVYELLLQLSLRFLYHKNPFMNWDRDVALLLRLEEIHRHLFDEIICIVRRRTEAQDIKTQEASFCELRVVIACVSTLFRLERKRRQEISTAVGEKKYLSFIHLFRAKIRELNEKLKLDASCEDHTDESESENGDQTEEGDSHFLNALAEVFSWIPRAFLDEWIVLSLKELLQSVNELSLVIKHPTIPPHKQLQYVRHGYQICKVIAVILRRTSDPEIQTMMVRVLGMDCPAIISLLRFVLSPQSLKLNGGREAVCIQVHVLNFLTAFVNRDIALPVQTDWESSNRKPSDDDEDAEIIEQLKGELLIRLLGPRIIIDDGEQTDQTLWEYLLELMFPNVGNNAVASFNATSRMLSSAVSFRSLSTPLMLLTSISRPHFEMKEAFTLLQQALYTAQDVSSQIDYEHCVASHWRRIEQYSDRIIENEGQEEPNMVYRMVELDFRCLIVLASRRSQFPVIQNAFNRNHLLSSVLQRLHSRALAPQDALSSRSNCESSDEDTTIPCLPPLRLPRLLSTGTPEVPSITKLSLSSPHSTRSPHEQVNVEQNFILLEPGLHALAIVLLATYVIVDPNLEIDEVVCPRISVPDQAEADPNRPSELLWKLQKHLACVEMDQRYFEALMVEMKTLQAFVSTGRLSAIRSLLRLLCPNRFDCNMHTQGDNQQAREYVAKGAFSTVYRQYPELPRSVAVKVVEHQRRAGEMCAVSGLFNEVSILSKLRGDLAATQLVDFGNHHKEQSFEIVMEYCPCSLTEWRATIKRTDSEVPFRSCLIMILRAFEQACKCLTRIHQAGICHFDIKSDNILVRTSTKELSRELLDIQKECTNYKGWLCFADFGESKIVDTDRIPVRTFTFSSFSSGIGSPVPVQKRAEKFMSLTRTRGTEAIKSPEVLKIKGSEVTEVKVTFASDIWSLGCLLYELVTQELLFQNDDWAGLYAHLVVTQDQDVLRSDHKQKIRDALNPTSHDEEAVVTNLLELCSKILVREPSRRPKLETITDQVSRLMNDVYALPVTSSDETYILSLNQLNGEPSTTDAQRPVPALRPISSIPSCRKHVETHGVIVPVRFFWNFFLAATVTRTQVTSCIASSSDPASKDVLVMDAFEVKYEADFMHFVYFSWYQSGEASAHEISRNLIEELHEEEHRTCFQLNPLIKSTDLFQHLMQHASQYFPVIQRRLQDEAGCVVFVALGTDAEDTKQLMQVLVSSLFFFFRNALEMSPFDILNYFARDCAQFFEYPRPEFLQHFMTSSRVDMEDTKSTMIQCRCGASIFTIETSVFTQALSTPSFHPFSVDNSDFDEFPVDTMFIYDKAEEELVFPLESRSKRGEEVPWIVLDAVSVGRSLPTSQNTSRPSRFGIFKRGSGKVAGESSPRPVDLELLLRGLQRGKLHDFSDTWELYECELCRLPICALSLDKLKVALPSKRI